MLNNDFDIKEHYNIISEFLMYLNNKSNDYILKGGTALMLCYNLDRFSEDIDLDSIKTGMSQIINEFCAYKDINYRVAKDTATVERYMLYYQTEANPLKIEISHRKTLILNSEITKINGINVYNIENLAIMKSNAYSSRDKIRDLYDVCFICNNYWEELNDNVKAIVRTALEYKGIEQYEFVIKDQKDKLIDNQKLLDDFLKTYEKVGLLNNTKLRSEMENNIDNDFEKDIVDDDF